MTYCLRYGKFVSCSNGSNLDKLRALNNDIFGNFDIKYEIFLMYSLKQEELYNETGNLVKESGIFKFMF